MSKIIPRFLYHLTSKTSYASILETGILKASNADVIGNCVYMTELTNLFKRWRKHKDWNGVSLMECLLGQCSKGDKELVMLRIPTKNINAEHLAIRSQNSCFKAAKTYDEKVAQRVSDREEAMKKFVREQTEAVDLKELEHLEKELLAVADKKYPCPDFDDLVQQFESIIKKCSSAKERKLFQQRKEAIEYIYAEDIPATSIEKIGEVNIPELHAAASWDSLKPMRSTFSALLRGTPEEKGALLLNC